MDKIRKMWYNKRGKLKNHVEKRRGFMLNPLWAANNLLARGRNDGIIITPMKLQKLLYLLYRQFYKSENRALFSERFEAWQYGPVLGSVYREFQEFKDKPIDRYYFENGKAIGIDENDYAGFKNAIDKVWSEYRDVGAIELSRRTHQPGSAWEKSKNYGYLLKDEDIRDEEWI